MIDKIKKHKKQLFELSIIFILTLIYNLICADLSMDEIWNYGFAYNIASGLIPYKDFNMIITPLFPTLGAIFLTIFGKNLLIYHIFNSIICTGLFYYIKKQIPNNYYILYMILLPQLYPSYNIFCLLLLYILMTLEEKNKNDYLIGIILGLTILTKQNIGIYLCIPTLFTKNIKKILKRIIGAILPIIILFIYLLINNNLYNFIDYVFLGINSFAEKNLSTNIIYILILAIINLIMIYIYIKNKDIKIIYLLSFELLVFPMVERYHITIAIIPLLGYLINKIKLFKKFTIIIFAIFIISIYSINIYKIYKEENTLVNITEKYKYRSINTIGATELKNISNYLKKIEDDIYIIYKNAYLVKLEADIKINKYDLLNEGNLGSQGLEKLVEELKENCQNKKCTFLIDSNEFSKKQMYAKEIIQHIIITYKQVDRIEDLIVYKNY